jgi:XTP/dITP diphosphohydrolase
MKPQLLIATGNAHKAEELAALLPDLSIRTLADHPDLVPAVEDGETFADNARKKAEHACAVLGVPVLADDSGLCVDALGGAPGVRSARYAEGTDLKRYQKLLNAMRDVPAGSRSAHFACAMAFAVPGEETVIEEARCDGMIDLEPRGELGFGYDPVFVVESGPRTMAQLSMDEKNSISHRARAIAAILPSIMKYYARR